MFKYYIVYKPFQTLSQFSPVHGKKTLKDYFPVARDVYSLGRLDYDSEGLLILSNDTSLNLRLLHPGASHKREYYVQVEGAIDQGAIQRLEKGIRISIEGKPYQTKPCRAYILPDDPGYGERIPPIRFRKNIPVSWISITLTEGKNRQVRKMTAAVGFPTLRLIRQGIEGITLTGLHPGDMVRLTQDEIYHRLFEGKSFKDKNHP
ncbi:MAG: pseudouridine synthase [Chitinophagales bacterium]